jgi:quercetin dioxygenase-like cupin family protein
MAGAERTDDDRPMADTQLKITADESVSVRRADEARLEVEVTYAPGGSPPPAHFHPTQGERFEILAGKLHARVHGEERVLGPGDTLSIPRGAVHTMWNPGDVPVRAIWETTPRGRTLEWFRAIDALHREGRVDKSGMPGPLAFGVLLTEYDDVFRLAARPRALIRLALRAMGAIGRLRGYSAAPPPLRSAA